MRKVNLKTKQHINIAKTKQPNPVIHMALWGFFSGFILADLYLVLLVDFFYGFDLLAVIIALLSPITLMLSFFFGGLVGLALGAIEGEVMRRFLMARTHDKVNPGYSRGTALRVYALCFILSAFGFTHFFIAGLMPERVGLLLVPLIAGIASVYAAHRYLLHLRYWNEQNNRQEFAKAKNVEHLEDKPKLDQIYFDDERNEEEARS